jgi:hypothetical protein
MTWSPATAIAGSAVVTLASCRIQIVRGDREPPRDCGTMAPGACCAGRQRKRRYRALMAPFSHKNAPITSDRQAVLLNDRKPLSVSSWFEQYNGGCERYCSDFGRTKA